MNELQHERLDKIRALLAKAEGTNHPEEAKLFTAKAQELMAKWAIDDAMLDASLAKPGNVIAYDIWIDANEYRSPKIQLIMAIAEVNDCKCVMYSQQYVIMPDGQRKRRFRFQVVGHDTDTQTVETLYTSLLTQASLAFLSNDVQIQMQMDVEHAGHTIRWRNSFMMSFAVQIRRILTTAKAKAKAAAESSYAVGCMAMVLVGRMALVERRFEEMHPDLGKGKSSSAGKGYHAAGALGAEAASRADLGRPKLGGNHKQIG